MDLKRQLMELIDNMPPHEGKTFEEALVDHLIANRIVINDGTNVISLPCPVGTTLYRIGSTTRACSYHHNTRDNLYYCVNDTFGVCKHICDGKCDAHTEYNIHIIQNANAQVILSNAPLLGTRVFLDKEEAEKELEKKRVEAHDAMLRDAVTLPNSYEGYRDYWDEDDEE